jgi:surface antigen
MSALDAFLRSPAATHWYALKPGQQQVQVIRVYRNTFGQSCKVIKQSVFISGTKVDASGTMCQQPDGRWALMQQ